MTLLVVIGLLWSINVNQRLLKATIEFISSFKEMMVAYHIPDEKSQTE